MPGTKKVVYLYQTGNPIDYWTVPADWNSADNSIECIGGGAGGSNYNTEGYTGAGGGGGGYSKIVNLTLTPGASVPYSTGIRGLPDVTVSSGGGDSWFNGTTFAGASVGAKGGAGPSSVPNGGEGGQASAGIGTTKYSGGNGGASAGNYFCGNGGGGGAAGPNGPGGTGGSADSGSPSNTLNGAGGGGGSNGAAGGNSTVPVGSAGQGGNNPATPGTDGSGTVGAAGPNGSPAGGGNGGSSPYGYGGPGGNGTEWDLVHGAGGGGGGGSDFATPVGGGQGGNYGGGGGSGDNGSSGFGGYGLIVVTYTAVAPPVPSTPPYGWLVTYEVSGSPATGSFVVRSNPGSGAGHEYLFVGDGASHSFTQQLRQRGQATYTLVVPAGDDYTPTQFQPIFLFDQTSSGYTLVFSGLLLDFTQKQIGINGDRYIECTATSLEALFDTVYVSQAMQFTNQTCGAILTALFNAFESGASVTLGTIQAGATVPLFNAEVGTKLSEIFDQLATTSEFTWGVDPQTSELYFQTPTATPAPFSITSDNLLWDSIEDTLRGSDYRNRQGVKLSYDAFPHSMEFIEGAGQLNITLMRPVEQVVAAYITLSTPNHATAAFSGQPSAGDTVTIGPATGVWQASHTYSLGGVIVVGGFVYVVTNAGTSGSSEPDFGASTVAGDTVPDNSVIWTCQGALGLGTGQTTYTFVETLDNTQYGQVLIDPNGVLANTVQNLADAINATVSRSGNLIRGVTFSLPTWENSQVNAIDVTSSGFTVQQKAAGTGYVAQLTASSSAFSWSALNTSGGSSPQGSLGPNEGATISIQVYQEGTSTAAPGLAYTTGSAVVSLATPLDAGSNLNVEYTRQDGDVIECERTDLVNALAVTMNGTGKIQQFTDQSQQGLISTSALSGLQLCQQILAAFVEPPTEIEMDVLQPGLLPGQILTVDLSGYWSIINGTYYIEEVRAQLIPVWPYLDSPPAPGAGHYRYTVKMVSTLIGEYMDVWESFGGGVSSATGGALVATSGGAQATQNQPKLELQTNGTDNSSQSVLNLEAGPGITLTDEGGGSIQIQSTTALPTAIKYTTSWSAQTSVTVTHNLGTTAVLVQVFDGSGNLVIPENIAITSSNVVTLTFGASFTGSVVVIGIGTSPPQPDYTTSWTSQTSVTVTHNLGTENVFVQVTDASENVVIPQSVTITSASVVTLTFGAAFTGSVLVVALPSQVKQYNTSWTSQTSVTVTHDLGTTAVIVQVFDSSGNQVIPQNVAVTDANDVTLTFGASFSGSCSVIG